jgi:multiple sugar transport system ATP-binding protein
MPIYGLDAVSVGFPNGRAGRTEALRGVSMQVAAGELVVILGATGSGKTTLLRVLAGLQKVDAGRVLEDGEDITNLSPHRRDMAMVFQNFSLYPRMTVGENLAFPLRAKVMGMSESEVQIRVREAAGILGLTDKLSREPGQLSGGELQRVAIGRALVRRPKMFLMDEPLASLDAKLREHMVIEIHRIQRSLGCGMIYVTHDHEEAMSLGDRIIVLDSGRILQSGTPEEIYRHPVDSRVAKMLGRPGINILTTEEAGRLGLPLTTKKFVGIRPESWKVMADANGPAIVSVVEHLGPLIALVLDVQGITLRVSVAPSLKVKLGDRFRLGMDAGGLVYLER